MLNKQTTRFRFIPFLHIPQNIPVSIPECPHSAGMIRHRNDENSRPSCQSSFLRNPPDSAGMTGFLQELGGHCKDLPPPPKKSAQQFALCSLLMEMRFAMRSGVCPACSNVSVVLSDPETMVLVTAPCPMMQN